MGELAADLLGADVTLRIGEDDRFAQLQLSFLFSRADTIYAGSSEVQRNIIGERVLGPEGLTGLPPGYEAVTSRLRVLQGTSRSQG
jgi:Acyl-CoA dehydrogenase, C-terminal domain